MTVSSDVSRWELTADGATTSFPFGGKIFDAANLDVSLISGSDLTAYTLAHDYSVNGVGNPKGGSVEFTTAPPAGTLVIRRVLPLTQGTDLKNQGAFLPDVIEDEFDRHTMTDQQLSDQIKRAFKLPAATPLAGLDFNLPLPTPDGYFRWNDTATGLVFRTPSQLYDETGIQAAVDAADNSETAAASSASTAQTAASNAVLAAQASGPDKIVVLHSDAVQAISDGSLVNGNTVEVLKDETNNGITTRYTVSGGALSDPYEPYAAVRMGTESGATVQQIVDRTALSVANKAAASALTTAHVESQHVIIGGDDGGVFELVTSTAAEDGGAYCGIYVHLSDTATTGKLLRRVMGSAVYLEWYGAPRDNSDPARNTAAFQAAIDVSESSGGYAIEFEGRKYTFDAGVTKAESFTVPIIRGAGSGYTVFDYSALGAVSFMTIVGGSGQSSGGHAENIMFAGSASSAAAEVQGQNGFNFRRCRFGKNAIGVLLHNKAAGSFTEFVQCHDCDWASACAVDLEYRVTDGNNSFHGSGIRNGTSNEALAGTTPQIKIGAGCLVYNAPLSVQIWKQTSQPLIQNDGDSGCYFHGDITTERFGTNPFSVASGNTVKLLGGTMAFSGGLTLGTAYLIERFQSNSNGSHALWLQPRQSIVTNVSDTISVPLHILDNTTLLVNIKINTSNYDYQYQLLVVAGAPQYGMTSITTLANTQAFNTAGYGAPTFSISGQLLQIVNSGYSGKTVTASATVMQIGGSSQSAGDLYDPIA